VWGEIAAYRLALECMLGPSGQQRLQQAVNERMKLFHSGAKTIYANFRELMNSA
jgi:hypothetical protein